jgi:hypothetical protein
MGLVVAIIDSPLGSCRNNSHHCAPKARTAAGCDFAFIGGGHRRISPAIGTKSHWLLADPREEKSGEDASGMDQTG